MRVFFLAFLVALASSIAAADVVTQPIEAVDDLNTLDGFVVEQVFKVPRETMGSWVSLAADGRGRLIASDQGGQGLYLITPGTGDKPTEVEKLPVELTSVQGITVMGDTCFAVVNGGGSGLYKLTASKGDGRFDTVEKLITLQGGGEHGPHAVRIAPDKSGLYVICGNHTKLPEGIESYLGTNAWGEDHLLPQRLDPRGHAAGITAPGGYIFKCDFDGKHIELVSHGYRNAYDMDFNADGELFAYDADMEWDMGLPWYRPTRVCHAIPGSEFGWRTGSGKWPTFYEDSLPAVVEIGPGSPVGVEFGYGLKFPAKYQKALYILDWTFGTIYTVTLTPDGSTFTGELEEFLSGKPLPLTDCAVGDDGLFYFTAGGRNTESRVYRVRYEGDESTAPIEAQTEPTQLAKQRHQLQSMGQQSFSADGASALALESPDRFVRYASRLALERQSPRAIRKVLKESKSAMAVAQASIALARQGKPTDLQLVARRLASLDLAGADTQTQSAVMRAMALAAIRLGPLEERQTESWLKSLRSVKDQFADYQTPEAALWYELMVYLGAPEAVELGVAVMQRMEAAAKPDWGYLVERSDQYGGTVGKLLENMPPIAALQVAFILRNAQAGWDEELARQYFSFFPAAVERSGGNSYAQHLINIREDAIRNIPVKAKAGLGEIIAVPLMPQPINVTKPKGPGREWTSAEALDVVAQLKDSSFENGRNLFHATSCIKCHRFNGEGDAIGPDLSTVANKFSKKDLIESLVEPSKTISDQYGSHQVITLDGRNLIGRVVETGDEIRVYTEDVNAPAIIVKLADVDEMIPSKVSQMPTKLLDELNEQELRDLVAYLLSAGDKGSAVYRN